MTPYMHACQNDEMQKNTSVHEVIQLTLQTIDLCTVIVRRERGYCSVAAMCHSRAATQNKITSNDYIIKSTSEVTSNKIISSEICKSRNAL